MPPQLEGSLNLGGEFEIAVAGFGVGLSAEALLSGKTPTLYWVRGELTVQHQAAVAAQGPRRGHRARVAARSSTPPIEACSSPSASSISRSTRRGPGCRRRINGDAREPRLSSLVRSCRSTLARRSPSTAA